MADKRVYTITINGLQESYEGVKNLSDALNSLTDTVVNVSKQESKTAATRNETKTATDQLAKAQEKLNNWDKEYQTELAKVNASLSDNKKEIKDAIKLQEAQATVDAKQLDSYRDKQTYLSALNTLIRNHSTATEEDRAAIDRMVQESAALQAELKATDAQMKIYVRNVGNYPGAAEMVVESHKSLKQELKELKTTMAEMLASGVSKTDEAYLKLAERAGQLKDAMSDANQDITNFASDTRGLTNAINLATSAVNVYQLYNSALQVFGGENEEAAKSMQKMMAVMTLLNSLQQVQNSLLENGSATARLYTKAVEMIQAALGIKKAATEADIAATEANTVAEETNTVATELNATSNEANAASTGTATTAETTNTGATTANTTAKDANTVATNKMSIAQKAGAVASNILSVALRAIPLMAIIGLVMALIQNWESIWNWFKKTFPVLDTLSKKFNKFGGLMNAIVSGAKAVAAAVVNFLINPFKTFANVVGKILSGDFEGAWKAALEGVKNQFKGTVDAFKGEIVKGFAEGQEQMTRKQAAEEDKRLTHHNNMITKQKNADGTYTKEYIEDTQKMYDNRKKMYKKGSDEYNKVLEDEAKFHQQVEDAKTAATEKATKARTKAAEKAAKDAKAAAEKAKKEYEDLTKAVKKDIEELDKLVDSTSKKRFKVEDERAKEHQKKLNKRAQESAAYWIEQSIGLAEVGRKLNELNEIIYEAETEGRENEAKVLSGYYNTINTAFEYINGLMNESKAQYDQFMDEIIMTAAKRQQTAVNNAAVSAMELKKQYDKQIEEAQKNLDKLNANSKATQDQISEAERALADAQKALEIELGEYKDKLDFYIPIDFDLDNLKKRFDQIKPSFAFTDVVNLISGVDGALEKLYKTAEKNGNIFETFRDLGEVLGLAKGELEGLGKDIEDYAETMQELLEAAMTDTATDKEFEEKMKKMQDIISIGEINIQKFGLFSKEVSDNVKSVFDDTVKMFDDAFKTFVTQQDKIISFNEKTIKRFQDATKDIKFEPVMDDKVMTKWFHGQILNIDKTRERYGTLRDAYVAYQKTLEKGSKEREAYEEAWQQKLAATKRQSSLMLALYGEESQEYKNAHMEYMLLIDEKKKADKAYELEHEKVTQQIEEIDKKAATVVEDYWKSVYNKVNEIYSAFSENVVAPIFDGLGDLFAFQLEEAQEALEKVEKLYDKAVEAREESAERMKQINDELRADDGQNKEALQQRLAEEEVLLVQREEQERALEKEKEKRKAEVEKKEAQQRKLELSQKLIEGIANTALGATAALKYGFPMGPIFAAIITAFGALQTALIAKQISKLEKGGKVGEQGVSRSHKQGGHRIEDTNIEVEGGEWVINRHSSKKYDTILRAINEDNPRLVRKQVEIIRERRIVNNGMAKFATGGQINTLTATRAVENNSQIQAITDLIRQIDFQPTVAVTDINKVTKNLVRVQQYAGKTA